MSTQAPYGMISAIVDLRSGTVLGPKLDEGTPVRLQDLAAAAPELLAVGRVSWEVIFSRLQSANRAQELDDVVLASEQHVYILLRSARDRGVGLVSVAPRTRNFGFLLSQARTRLRELEEHL